MGRYRVLLVDVDPQLLEKYSSLLAHAGYKVEGCTDPGNCLFRVRKFHPDCVVLDFPAAAGSETLSWLANQMPETVNVLCAGEDEKLSASHLVRCGVSKVLQKPFSPEAFLDGIQQAIAERHFRRAA